MNGAEVLRAAEITPPEGFDMTLLESKLEDLELQHLINKLSTGPTATEREREAVAEIVHTARKLAKLLRSFLDDGGTRPTDPVSRVPGALADVLSSPDADKIENEGKSHIASRPLGMSRLKSLVGWLDMLAAAGPSVQDQLKGDALFPREKGITPWVELLGRDLPALYQELFGRPFTLAAHGTPNGVRYSEGVRFVAAAATRIQRLTTCRAVIDAGKVFRAGSKEG